jgi:hypothetical protein
MVSAWWLLVALWVGGCIGFLLSAMLTVSKAADPPHERAAKHDGRLAHRGH